MSGKVTYSISLGHAVTCSMLVFSLVAYPVSVWSTFLLLGILKSSMSNCLFLVPFPEAYACPFLSSVESPWTHRVRRNPVWFSNGAHDIWAAMAALMIQFPVRPHMAQCLIFPDQNTINDFSNLPLDKKRRLTKTESISIIDINIKLKTHII